MCVQRFDSALRLDVHDHAVVLDGVYTDLAVSEQPRFHPLAKPTDDDIARLVRHIRVLVLGHLRRRGHVDYEDRVVRTSDEEVGTLEVCQAAAVRGVTALGPAAGLRDQQLGCAPPPRSRTIQKELCAEVGGFSLHAALRLASGRRDRLQRLCRYLTRSPLAQDRLSTTADGRVVYRLERPWRNGVEAVALQPLVFLERLAALIPRPRTHLLTYHGLFAPAAMGRERIVPPPPTDDLDRCESTSGKSTTTGTRRRRATWAEMMHGSSPSTFCAATAAEPDGWY